MQYNDSEMPNEYSMQKMRQEYANKVSVLQNETNTNQNVTNIDWDTNIAMLKNLGMLANNTANKNYICNLIPLAIADRDEINTLLGRNNIRTNPSLMGNMPQNFNIALREYLRNEAQLLDNLVALIDGQTDALNRTNIISIVRRRLDALDTLASFWTNGLFN